ncbi:uncharacterized protein STEHIDRAFT_52074 [Stereum hirsutum FP-91666 SS1]|uniref:uncharacterized protein n=1 Tax=Stereum hirsutum (strain FP-91666) TaxID=721885 RepID=UPI000440B9EB|nr:uncharacterized protein STEHIDRAFT_52074 [Stereum hirsutum FP-91666 SS1]EIM89779.1 hypothetical protein STEHIDRAFT_52074 [Stereum hirsutum FP-91666 SS1]
MSSVTRSASSAKSIPRPSASIILINSANEVLLVQRNKTHSFGGMHVFPGGNYDAKQDESYEMTAIRETFEETGVLLASASASSPTHFRLTNEEMERVREEIHSGRLLFKDFLHKHGLTPDVSSLLPFTQWVTPPPVLRRFHAYFFVYFLLRTSPSSIIPASDSAGLLTQGQIQHRRPTPDGAHEIISCTFSHPLSILSQHRSGKLPMMPPQFYLLSTLASAIHGRATTPYQISRVRELSAGHFGRMVIHPGPHPGGRVEDQDGRTVLTFEGDETRGGSTGRLHRALVKFDNRGVPLEISLLRNWDIFAEVEIEAFVADPANVQSKL